MSTCSTIDIQKARGYDTMLHNDTLMLSNLQDMYVNYTGDWSVKMQITRQTLRKNQIFVSPGSEIIYCQIYNNLWSFLPPIILALGTIGNLLSFTVLCRQSMIQVSSYIYLAVLALVDEGVLITGLLRKWIDHMNGNKLDNTSRVACKLVNVFGLFSSYFSVWLIVALTVERAIVITFPLRASRLATPRRAKFIIVLTGIACFLLSSHFFQTVDLIPLHDATKCDFQSQYNGFVGVWTWLDAAIYSYLPFGVITVLNVIIIHGVYRARQNRQEMTRQNGGPTKQPKSSRTTAWKKQSTTVARTTPPKQTSSTSSESVRQLTILLLAISLFFLVFTTPIVVVKFAVTLYQGKSNIGMRNNMDRIIESSRLQLVDSVADMLMYCNHAVNFFLYCAMGNKFRQQLLSLFCVVNKRHNNYPGGVSQAALSRSLNNRTAGATQAGDQSQENSVVLISPEEVPLTERKQHFFRFSPKSVLTSGCTNTTTGSRLAQSRGDDCSPRLGSVSEKTSSDFDSDLMSSSDRGPNSDKIAETTLNGNILHKQ